MLNKLRQDMILLSTSANIISRMTAFVAVDKDAKKPVEGEMVRRPCPVPVATREFYDGLMNQDHFQIASTYCSLPSTVSSPRRYLASCDNYRSCDYIPVSLIPCSSRPLPQERVSAKKRISIRSVLHRLVSVH